MRKLFLLMATLLLSVGVVSAQKAENKKTQQWFDSKEWLNGGTFRPATSIDIAEFAAHYEAHPNRWNKLFNILASDNLGSLPLGFQEVNENLKMNIQEYETRPTVGKKLLYEKHGEYIDVQCVVVGEELHGTRKVKFGKVVNPYVKERDIAMYECEDVPFYIIKAGEFTIFFPDDIHTTNYGFGERTKVRKIVFKVKYN